MRLLNGIWNDITMKTIRKVARLVDDDDGYNGDAMLTECAFYFMESMPAIWRRPRHMSTSSASKMAWNAWKRKMLHISVVCVSSANNFLRVCSCFRLQQSVMRTYIFAQSNFLVAPCVVGAFAVKFDFFFPSLIVSCNALSFFSTFFLFLYITKRVSTKNIKLLGPRVYPWQPLNVLWP